MLNRNKHFYSEFAKTSAELSRSKKGPDSKPDQQKTIDQCIDEVDQEIIELHEFILDQKLNELQERSTEVYQKAVKVTKEWEEAELSVSTSRGGKITRTGNGHKDLPIPKDKSTQKLLKDKQRNASNQKSSKKLSEIEKTCVERGQKLNKTEHLTTSLAQNSANNAAVAKSISDAEKKKAEENPENGKMSLCQRCRKNWPRVVIVMSSVLLLFALGVYAGLLLARR